MQVLAQNLAIIAVVGAVCFFTSNALPLVFLYFLHAHRPSLQEQAMAYHYQSGGGGCPGGAPIGFVQTDDQDDD